MKLLSSAGCLFLPIVIFWVLALGAILVVLREAGAVLLAGFVGLAVGLAAAGLGGADRDIAVLVAWLAFVGVYAAMLWRRWQGVRGDSGRG